MPVYSIDNSANNHSTIIRDHILLRNLPDLLNAEKISIRSGVSKNKTKIVINLDLNNNDPIIVYIPKRNPTKPSADAFAAQLLKELKNTPSLKQTDITLSADEVIYSMTSDNPIISPSELANLDNSVFVPKKPIPNPRINALVNLELISSPDLVETLLNTKTGNHTKIGAHSKMSDELKDISILKVGYFYTSKNNNIRYSQERTVEYLKKTLILSYKIDNKETSIGIQKPDWVKADKFMYDTIAAIDQIRKQAEIASPVGVLEWNMKTGCHDIPYNREFHKMRLDRTHLVS